jgi:TonB family protein
MMNRLEKKCVIASTAFHTTLLGILLFGSALMPGPSEKAFNPITVYSSAAVSDALSSGPSAPANLAPAPAPPAAPANPQPEATPKPKAQPQPDPVQPPKAVPHETPKPPVDRVEIPKDIKIPKNSKVKPDKISLPDTKEATVKPPKEPHKIVLDSKNSKLAMRKPDESAKAAQEAAQNAANDARKKTAREIASSLKNISKNLSSSTLVDTQFVSGNGTPGEVSVNYRELIASIYYNAWSASADLDDTTPVVLATVTIARNGNVISARITKPSGNAAMDRSIANVLQTVTFIEPFPSGSTDQERTVTVKFNLLAKRGTG